MDLRHPSRLAFLRRQNAQALAALRLGGEFLSIFEEVVKLVFRGLRWEYTRNERFFTPRQLSFRSPQFPTNQRLVSPEVYKTAEGQTHSLFA
jgi:hypothetical protein